jgi:hypothetical protein
MKKYCKVCQSPIPEKRVQLGYADTCVNHSSTFKYVGFVASTGKVDYEVNVVRSEETAKHMQKLVEMRGMS